MTATSASNVRRRHGTRNVFAAVGILVVVALMLGGCAVPNEVDERVNGNAGINIRTFTTDDVWQAWKDLTAGIGSPAIAGKPAKLPKVGDDALGGPIESVEDFGDYVIVSNHLFVWNVGIVSMKIYLNAAATFYVDLFGSPAAAIVKFVHDTATPLGKNEAKYLKVINRVLPLAGDSAIIRHAHQAVSQRSPDGCLTWKFGGTALYQTTINGTPTFMGDVGNVAWENTYCKRMPAPGGGSGFQGSGFNAGP